MKILHGLFIICTFSCSVAYSKNRCIHLFKPLRFVSQKLSNRQIEEMEIFSRLPEYKNEAISPPIFKNDSGLLSNPFQMSNSNRGSQRIPNDLLNPTDRGRSVRIFSEKELKKFEIEISSTTGILRWKNGKIIDLPWDSLIQPTPPIYVAKLVERKLKIFIFQYPEIGIYHHSSLARGGEIIMGGHITISQGEIQSISNKSGHYRPSAPAFYNFINWLISLGVKVPLNSIEIIN